MSSRATLCRVTQPRIGVVLKTHNRPGVLAHTLEQHKAHHCAEAIYAVVDDGSTQPAVMPEWVELSHRFEPSRGIVAAGNKSIELLMAAGVDHLFLWDDDAYPVADEWWRPYVDSAEPHLMAQFLDLSGRRSRALGDMRVLYADSQHTAYSGARGFMLYLHRSAVEAVGGFDPAYGRGMYEHADLSNRIHARGLTTWRFADVTGSAALVHSMDQFVEVERSVSRADRRAQVSANGKRYVERLEAGFDGYVEYREPRDVVITCLYSGVTDPQRPGHRLPPTLAPAAEMVRSVTGAGVVIHADRAAIDSTGSGKVEVVRSELATDLFFQRHLEAYRYLRAHPEVRYAWCVDATDVVQLREPWAEMEPGKLYLGWEPKILSDSWMTAKHTFGPFERLVQEQPGAMLLNAGLIGGDRATVMSFLRDVVSAKFDHEARVFLKTDHGDVGSDMGAVNLVARTKYADRLVTGPRVATVFKRHEVNGWSWWQHK